jgi:hypothetical protein
VLKFFSPISNNPHWVVCEEVFQVLRVGALSIQLGQLYFFGCSCGVSGFLVRGGKFCVSADKR